MAGEGSIFEVRLPADVVDPREETVPAPTPVVAADSPSPGAKLVLVVDDDPVAHDLMRRSLTKAGFRVETAAGGVEGIRRPAS